MSAIAGFWRREGDEPAITTCTHMLDRLVLYGPDGIATLDDGTFAAGKCHRDHVPCEDEDRGPIRSDDGRYLLTADIRLDNAGELKSVLGLAASSAVGDSRLLLEGYVRFGRAILDRLLGDFAFAIWDGWDRSLFLARDPMGEKPLHYSRAERFAAFSSMPGALARVARTRVDEMRLAEFVADLWPHDDCTYFRGIERVQPGHWVSMSAGRTEVAPYWNPRSTTLHLAGVAEYAEAMRAELDQAVTRRLRRTGGAVGAHLSSGLDSSAVASAAALALGEQPLYAFTSAPREGFDGPVPEGWAADESAVAAATARLHPNIRHVIVRPRRTDAGAALGRAHRLAWQPTAGVMNAAWWDAINQAACQRGVTVMLTGEVGNFTISAGLGTDQLRDLMRERRFSRWWREARALAGSEFGWRTILNGSFGASLPAGMHRALRRGLGRDVEPESRDWFVTQAYRAAVAREERRSGLAGARWRSGFERRLHLLRGFDPGNYRKRSLAQWGIEERDVTADRRLAEFCLSLPVEALLHEGERRPALRRALAGRVAPEVLSPRARGYQSADWFERVDRAALLRWADRVDRPPARRVVDLDSVRRIADTWPGENPIAQRSIALYPMSLLRALSAAQFANDMDELLRDDRP